MARLPVETQDSAKSLAPFSLRYAPGHRVAGKYQLLRPLEEGGMGVVWVAHHVDLDVQVAVKVLRTEVDPGQMAERLQREAQSAARIDHPAVVRVLDSGRTAEGDPFLVMELLDGEALAEVLDREHRLDAIVAVRTLLPIVGALEALHAREMIHRDVKPENIFLAKDDSGRARPKLIDFGLARVPSRRITQKGVVMGTPAYMAPEQLRGADPDAAADLWAIAAVLYESVTGTRPLEGDDYIQLLAAAVAGRMRSLMSHGVAEPDLWSVLERALAPIGTRWPSAHDFGRALALWLWSRGVTDDVSGVSLRAAWLGDDDVRRTGRSQVQTQRLPSLAEMRASGPPTNPIDGASIPAGAMTVAAPPPVPQSPPPVVRPAPSSDTRQTVALVLAGIAVATAVAALLSRGGEAPVAPAAAAPAVSTATITPAVPPSLPAKAEGTAPPTAGSTTAPPTASTAAPPVDATVPAALPASSASRQEPQRPATRRTRSGAELKNPFH